MRTLFDPNRFLSLGIASAMGAAGMAATARAAEPTKKPNILLIIADQHHEAVMSNAGCEWVKTPGMDKLAANGVRFPNSYVSLPVCLPQRFTMFTGMLPQHRTGKAPKTDRTTANILRETGYETAYFGKWHISGYDKKQSVEHGFDVRRETKDPATAKACIEFLGKTHDKPFFAVASFYNPHDICEWGRARSGRKEKITMKNGAKPTTKPPLSQCPTLPPNFDINADEAEAIQIRRHVQNRPQKMTETWDKEAWRQYRWAYAQLVQAVDKHVLNIQKALEKNGLDKDTIVIYTSDHGDGIGAHRWHQKSVLYEESVRVPFIIQWKGKLPAGVVRKDLLASGLDLLPTFCAAAGVGMPKGDYTGKDVLAMIRAPGEKTRHPYVVCRTDGEYGTGRMLRTADYKYMVFSSGKNREQLFDMTKDPGETTNLVKNPKFAKVLDEHRAHFKDWCTRTTDDYEEVAGKGGKRP